MDFPEQQLTTDEYNTWEQIVAQCKDKSLKSIDVAGEKRRSTLLKVDKIASLVILPQGNKLEEDIRIILKGHGIFPGVIVVNNLIGLVERYTTCRYCDEL